MATQKQLAANRRNAQKSTGPKTSDGKAVAKMNAVKHGILSADVVVRGLCIKENNREFKNLLEEFWAHFAPVGPVEAMLVGEIVNTHWRLRRVVTAEGGEIALSVDSGQWRRQHPSPLVRYAQFASPIGDVVDKLKESATGLDVLIHILEAARADIEREGDLTEACLHRVQANFGDKPNSLVKKLTEFRAETFPPGADAAAQKMQRRQAALDYLTAEMQWRRYDRRIRAEWEEQEERARQAAAVLPSAATLERILRYETTLNRQLYRAMNQLERLQRMRQGEAVPAPLTMDVNGEGESREK